MTNHHPGTGAAFDPVELLGSRVSAAIGAAAPGAGADADPMISASKRAELGDFQSNAAMPLAKRLGTSPRELAARIVANLDVSGLCEPVTESDIAGPGFINFRLKPDALAALLARMDAADLGLAPPESPRTIVVDLCGVNLAKQMHVGHLRSTVIGDALARTFERLGERVIRQNHVGDWGLPIAMVTEKVRSEGAAGRLSLEALTLDDLDRLYKLAQRECAGQGKALGIVAKYRMGPKIEAELTAQHEEAMERLAGAKRALVALQRHEPEVYGIWRRIYDITMTACLGACRRLHTRITAEASAGESSYSTELAPLVADLTRRGVATESAGALVVRLDSPDDGAIAEPCIIRKSDGGYLYATTDMAAIRRRVQQLGADRVIYTVDARQSLHFRQVFGAARKAGYATKPGASAPSTLEHAAFGTVLGEDGKPLKTRSGENIRLSDLLDEAVERAMAPVIAKDDERAAAEGAPPLPDADRRAIAEAVGIAAVKYADLSGERIKDYVFSFDRMLAFEGNTGPYLLYALVRIRSVFRKASERGIALDEAAPLLIAEPTEKALALELLRYPGQVRAVAATLEPYKLCAYLYSLAGAYSSFYTACHVLNADTDQIRASRLRLCHLTARVLEDGLNVLGLPTVERM
ncbi:MAG TPA: arginine--tRNA ligase [Phycisphaerales bacterium]|nr:arginine--tRNA ligase [Phycisphaerales bacterium]